MEQDILTVESRWRSVMPVAPPVQFISGWVSCYSLVQIESVIERVAAYAKKQNLTDAEALRKLVSVTLRNGAPYVKYGWLGKGLTFPDVVKKFRGAYQDARLQPRVQSYRERGEWIKYVLSFPRFVQVEAFTEIAKHLSDPIYWRLLGHIFNAAKSPNHAVYRDLYLHLMRSPRPHHMNFHTPRQQAEWDVLPDKVMIFRAHTKDNKLGIHYTVNLSTAMNALNEHLLDGFSAITDIKISGYLVNKRDLFYGGGPSCYRQVFFVQGLGAIHKYDRA